MLFTDMEVLLPHQFLEKVDRSTMAHGIETRVPFLDNRLVEYVMALPSSLKLRRGVSKWLLRTAMEPQLPKEIVHGPKTGFGVPYHYWIGGPLASYARSVLLAPEMADLFDRSVLATKLDEHQDGRGRHGFLLWKALNLALWYRRYGVEA
jgi:asparagine synthase (glutamine-hydrolysing)